MLNIPSRINLLAGNSLVRNEEIEEAEEERRNRSRPRKMFRWQDFYSISSMSSRSWPCIQQYQQSQHHLLENKWDLHEFQILN